MPKKALAKWAAVLAIAAAGLWFNAKYFNLNPSHIREGVLSFGVFAPLMYIGLLMVRPFLLLTRIRPGLWISVFFYRSRRRSVFIVCRCIQARRKHEKHAFEA
ncbi:hypothetical protein [Bacillus sp. IG6]|uniref:hypothetical protein n=1 Tax=Bacillus TaxID=1386 RepID=UPI0008151E1F|nr:hypothetical protein [Bacillus glycinifermentans]MED8020628.1 hypothetical protein [Bacillus glycinifermentans]WKB76196.1 hypothetical protein QYM22_17585 [Bacillus glycinifermentans]SCA87257.1 hypothetical protein BGLY_3434 [Bacillus glycinifermentans]